MHWVEFPSILKYFTPTSLKLHFNEKDGRWFQLVTDPGLFMKNRAATSVSLLPFMLPLSKEMNYSMLHSCLHTYIL